MSIFGKIMDSIFHRRPKPAPAPAPEPAPTGDGEAPAVSLVNPVSGKYAGPGYWALRADASSNTPVRNSLMNAALGLE